MDGLLCSIDDRRVKAVLFAPALGLSLILVSSAIKVAFYTIKARRRTRDDFIGFYIRISVFACLIGLLVLSGAILVILKRYV